MAITVERAYEDVTGDENADGGSRSVPYLIFGSDDADDVMNALISDSDPTEAGLTAGNWGGLTRLAENVWRGVVQYGMLSVTTAKREPPQEVGEGELSFDTTGGTKKISHYLSTPTSTSLSTVPDFKGAIAVTKSGIEGAEIGEASCKFQISKTLNDVDVPSSYLDTLFRYTYCVNTAAVTLNANGKALVFAPGELLFLGASVTFSRATQKWRIVYQFAGKPNDTRTVNGMAISVRGWDYVWIYTEPRPQSSGGFAWVIQEPRAVYAGKVYREADLNYLGV